MFQTPMIQTRNSEADKFFQSMYVKHISPVDFKRTPNGVQSMPEYIKYPNYKIPQVIGTSESEYPYMTNGPQVLYNNGALNYVRDRNGSYIWNYQAFDKVVNPYIAKSDYQVNDQLNQCRGDPNAV